MAVFLPVYLEGEAEIDLDPPPFGPESITRIDEAIKTTGRNERLNDLVAF